MQLGTRVMQQIKDTAEYLKVDVAFLLAVIEKESAGRFFWNVNGAQLPAIRIEGHYFHRILKRERPHLLSAAVDQGLANPRAGAVKNPTRSSDRYVMLDRMAQIDREAAYRSISIGAGQIMGEHYRLLGYATAHAMWTSARSAEGQVQQILRFIEKNPAILSAARARDFQKFARLYNGPAFRKNNYDVLLKRHYDRWKALPNNRPIVDRADDDVWITRIKALGYPSVVAFQRHYGLKVDGIVGPITREAVVAAEADKAKPVKDAAVVASGATAAAAGAVTLDQIAKHVEAVKPVIDTVAGMNINTILVVAGIVVVGAIAYGLYKWWKS